VRVYESGGVAMVIYFEDKAEPAIASQEPMLVPEGDSFYLNERLMLRFDGSRVSLFACPCIKLEFNEINPP
jgi:hypothetical protein